MKKGVAPEQYAFRCFHLNAFLALEKMNLEQLMPDRLTRGAGQLDRPLL
jgi:hypothetical protein